MNWLIVALVVYLVLLGFLCFLGYRADRKKQAQKARDRELNP